MNDVVSIIIFLEHNCGKGGTAERKYENDGPDKWNALDIMVYKVLHYAHHSIHH